MFDVPEPLRSFLDDLSALQFILWVLAAAFVVFSLIKLWPFVKNAVAIVTALLELPALVTKLSTLSTDVATIKHEVLPNTGGSLKDQATRTEQAVAEVRTELAHIRRQQASTKTTLRNQSQTLKVLAARDDELAEEIEHTRPKPP